LLAPTGRVSSAPPGELQGGLRGRGVRSVVEGPDGRVLVAERAGRRDAADGAGSARRGRVGRRTAGRSRTGVVPGSGARAEEPAGTGEQRFADLVARLRAADARVAEQAGPSRAGE